MLLCDLASSWRLLLYFLLHCCTSFSASVWFHCGSHVVDVCLTEEQGAGGVHRDPETTNQRAGGKGDKADMMQHHHGNTYTSSNTICFSSPWTSLSPSSFCFYFFSSLWHSSSGPNSRWWVKQSVNRIYSLGTQVNSLFFCLYSRLMWLLCVQSRHRCTMAAQLFWAAAQTLGFLGT